MVLPLFPEIIEPERICENCKWFENHWENCPNIREYTRMLINPLRDFDCKFWEIKDKWIMNKE